MNIINENAQYCCLSQYKSRRAVNEKFHYYYICVLKFPSFYQVQKENTINKDVHTFNPPIVVTFRMSSVSMAHSHKKSKIKQFHFILKAKSILHEETT